MCGSIHEVLVFHYLSTIHPMTLDHVMCSIVGKYRIAGIFHGGKYYFFFSNKSIFINFIFVFASSALFYNTGGHTHFVKFYSFLNNKNKN